MDKEQAAIMRLQQASEMSMAVYEKPLVICHSGGKDSTVLAELAYRANIPYEITHSHTTADAPETVRFVKYEMARLSEDARCQKTEIIYPRYKGSRTTMWALITQKKIPPTRNVRYCCSILKENTSRDRFIATGVRWAESKARKDRGIYERLSKEKAKKIILNNDNDDIRQLFENCRLKGKRVVNPIIDWEDREIWDFIDSYHLQTNRVYEYGCRRAGCIGCPMANRHEREREFAIWPKYEAMYKKAFEKMLISRGITPTWKTGEDVFNWWMEYDVLPGQMTFDLLGSTTGDEMEMTE